MRGLLSGRVCQSLFALIIFLSCSTALATTVTLPRDEDLIADARAIVRGRVLSVVSAMDGGRIFTYTTLRVRQVFKGRIQTNRIVIKEEGGIVAGLGSIIWGTPQFVPDEEVLLYLTTRPDGSLRVHNMFLGKFNIIEEDGRQIVARSPIDENVRVLRSQISDSESTERMELSRYIALIRGKVAATRERFRRYEETWFQDTPLRASPPEFDSVMARGNVEPQFTFIRSSLPVRWFEPDDNQPVVFQINPDGAPNPQIVDDINAAMNAWSTIPGCTMRVVNGGTTSDCYPRGVGNTMVFNNCDSTFTPVDGCSSVIAIGGVNWDTSITRTVNGVSFAKVYQGHVTFNPFSACSYDNHCNIQEIVTHELGHALGLGHSADVTATMAGTAHFDGRCASLRSDDMDGMRFIYPAPESGGSALRILTENLPDATISSFYEQTLLAAGGVTPFTWSVAGGPDTLPAGMTFLPSGLLRGTPLQGGTSTFTLQVRDAVGATTQRAFTLSIGTEQMQYASQFITQNVPAIVPAGQAFTASIRWSNIGTRPWDGLNGCHIVAINPLNNTTWGGASVDLLGFNILPNQDLDLAFTAHAPQSPGIYNFQWQLYQDGVGVFGQPSANVQITVSGDVQPPSISSPSTIETTAGAAFNQTLQGTGGTTPYTWSLAAGVLPPGLSLNGNTGVISGTPGTVGSYSFTVQLRDTQGRTAQRAMTINVSAPAPPLLDITITALPDGSVNAAFNAQIAVLGGVPPYTWAIAAGALPNGLTLNAATGVISGSPTLPGNFTFTARVADAAQHSAQRALAITVNPPPLVITTATLNSAVVRANFAAQFAATGGVPPYAWAVVSGALPDGLRLDAATGNLLGAPTRPGNYSFTIEADDTQRHSARRDFSINVLSQPLTIERATTSFEVMQGTPFAYQVNATGGIAPYTWTLTSGRIPQGLTFNNNTGVLTGTPASSGTFSFVITVRDQKPDTVSASIQIKVIDPDTVPLITKITYKTGKRMLQVFGARFDPSANLLLDGVAIAKFKFSDGAFIAKKLALAAGQHQVVVINPGGISSQPFFLNIQ